MSGRSLRYLRAGLGAVVLVALVLVVRGWWGEYRDAVSRASTNESTATVATSATVSPEPDPGEGSDRAEPAPQKDKTGSVTVLIDGLNFRQRPAADAKPIRGLRKGEVLTVLSERAGWYEVRSADGTKGWVSSNPNYTELER